MVAGRNFAADDGEGLVLISTKLAQKLGFDGEAAYTRLIGQKLTLVTDPYYQGPGANIPQNGCPNTGCGETLFPATVVGVYEGDAEASIPFAWARILAVRTQQEGCDPQAPGCTPQGFIVKTYDQIEEEGYRTFAVQVKPGEGNGDRVAKAIQDQLNLGAVSGEAQLREQERALTTVGLIVLVIGAIALLVAAIGVVNTMVMAALERTREIGVMRAIGATKRTVRRLFTVEAAMIGFLGGLVVRRRCGVAAGKIGRAHV